MTNKWAVFNLPLLVYRFLLTLLFTPDPLRVSLTEVDRRWSYIRAGKEYHGEAVNPWNLSMFERFLGHHKTYNLAKDEEDRYLFSSCAINLPCESAEVGQFEIVTGLGHVIVEVQDASLHHSRHQRNS